MDIEAIKKEVYKAREVFEKHCNHISKTFFGDFPSASCGPSADLIAEYLLSKGVQNIEYVYGERNGGSHGWLEIEGHIIDITGDQFEEGIEGVFISSNRDFHNQFSPQTRNDKPGVNGILRDPYNKFKALMETHA
ncbi:hypothetical protein PspMM1_19180 [Pseudoalteromonas sp. MM1]|uniref:hypothetical protein n=1 Tax=Pseudoalteromonas sp. MM1 TaxID=3036714 RepID=UPI0025745DE3|nr:hypothetical protein [Pseudoalteromonas sp. MM1]BED89450.1 hypothetical protein PspMM1_19180 [Pseudoalteromonas sp. MM1]